LPAIITSAAVQVVELALRDRIVDVDRREAETALAMHLIEPLDAGRRFLGDALDRKLEVRIERRIARQPFGNRREQREFLLAGRMRDHRPILLGCSTDVHQQRCVAAVVEDHVGFLRTAPFEDPVREFPVLRKRLALVREYRRAARGDRRRCVILR
jgi:hypothetical protein